MGSQAEHIIRVTADRLSAFGEGAPIIKDYTLSEIVTSAYRWGRHDGRQTAEGLSLFGVGEDWTVITVPLAELRSTYATDTQDGVHEVVRRDG